MNRFTTTVASLAALCLTTTLALSASTAPTTSAGESFSATGKIESGKSAAKPGSGELDPGSHIEPTLNVADLNRDFNVDVNDLMIVLAHWGEQGRGERNLADIAPETGDYMVNFNDMLLVLIYWGA